MKVMPVSHSSASPAVSHNSPAVAALIQSAEWKNLRPGGKHLQVSLSAWSPDLESGDTRARAGSSQSAEDLSRSVLSTALTGSRTM